MKIPDTYVSGPHAGDYYLLQDEQSEQIFDARLAEHIRETGGLAASLLEMWIDDDQRVWYVFQAGARQ
jgi:hypothetical protein